MAELTKFTARPNQDRRTLENIQVSAADDRIRLVAADGWILAVCDLPLQTDDKLPPGEYTTLIHAPDIRAVARDLKQGPMRGQALSAQIDGDLITLTSQRSNVKAPPATQTQFPNWQALMPRPTGDEDFHRFAAGPTLIGLAASLCKAIGGQMTFTAADNSSPIRIDCTSLSLKFHQPPRAVIAAMPIFSKWDNPTAIDLHPDTETAEES